MGWGGVGWGGVGWGGVGWGGVGWGGVPMHVKLGDALLEQADNFKYLGLKFDLRLNWKCPVKAVSSKAAQHIGALCRARQFIYSWYR